MEVFYAFALIVVCGSVLYWIMLIQEESEKETRKKAETEIENIMQKIPNKEWEFKDSFAVDIISKQGTKKHREIARLGISKETKEFMIAWISMPYEPMLQKEIQTASGVWSLDKIISVQLAVNEEKSTITSGKVGGKTGSALVGTLLFGPAGGIVGSAGSREIKSRSEEISKVISLALEIQIADPEVPYIYIHFFFAEVNPLKAFDSNSSDMRQSVSLEELRTKSSFKSAQKWYGLLNSSSQSSATANDETSSELKKSMDISGEIGRLHDLKNQGAISEEEFSSAKKALLEKLTRQI